MRNFFLATVQEAEKPEIKVPADLVSGEGTLSLLHVDHLLAVSSCGRRGEGALWGLL